MLIHQSWKDENVPKQFLNWQQQWKDLHPRWHYHLWTDEDNRELVKKHYPWFLSTYDAFPMGVMRADSVRYMYMHHYGGVYGDLDMDPLKPTDDLIETLDVTINHSAIVGYMGTKYEHAHNVPNAWMMSSPGHPFWMFCLMRIMTNNINGENRAEYLTGPVLLKEAVKEYTEANQRITGQNVKGVDHGDTKINDLHILRPGLIFPYNWEDSEKNIDVCGADKAIINSDPCRKRFPDAFTVTYWTHSWE